MLLFPLSCLKHKANVSWNRLVDQALTLANLSTAHALSPQVFSVPELITATLEQVRQCSVTAGVPARQTTNMSRVIQALEFVEDIALTAEGLANVKFVFSGPEADV